jgi:RNase P/RNase MRP subunit p30
LFEFIEKSAQLGYNSVGITFPLRASEKDVQRVKNLCNNIGINLVTRIDLNPKNPNDLLRNLRYTRRKAEIIAVRCYSKGITRQAAKDNRVDLLYFPLLMNRKKYFNRAVAELASKALCSLEINMTPLLFLQGFKRINYISILRKEAIIAKKFAVPLVLTSGANDVTLLRRPEDYASLAWFFGLDLHRAKLALSENPRSIITRNLEKLNSNYIAPGIRLVKK